MIVMTPDATEAEVAAVRARLETTGVHVVVMPGELTTAIGAIGDPEGVAELGLEGMSGVDRVVPISRPYKLASSELYHEGPTVLDIAGRSVGGGDTFCLIAGPCTVESRDQTLEVARAVHAAGASMLRGGAFKPRTSPFAFQGLGNEALEILAEARAETGLPVVTELLDTQHADAIAEHADVVQIGARNMQNYALLEVAGKLGKPVLLKRGLSSSLDELLQAADYILKEGNEAVMLCERGIRTFETATRFTLDLGAVPWLKLHTHLPVIVDPSHAAGDRRLVEPLSRAAAAVGADGIIVEVHEDPDAALCDGPQALSTSHFARLRARRRGARGAAGQAPGVVVRAGAGLLVVQRLQDVEPRGPSRRRERASTPGDDRDDREDHQRADREDERRVQRARHRRRHQQAEREPEPGADERGDDALVAHHAAHLAARHADGAHHADLAGALEHREHERVDHPEQADDDRQREQHVEQHEELPRVLPAEVDPGRRACGRRPRGSPRRRGRWPWSSPRSSRPPRARTRRDRSAAGSGRRTPPAR